MQSKVFLKYIYVEIRNWTKNKTLEELRNDTHQCGFIPDD